MFSLILSYLSTISAAYGFIVAISTFIVKKTQTTKDDEFVSKIIKFLDNFSTAFTKEDLEKLAFAEAELKKKLAKNSK